MDYGDMPCAAICFRVISRILPSKMKFNKENDMRLELISEKGNFYKVNFHCHTDVSDGKLSPKEIKERYKALGYSAVCFTDHELLVPHNDISDDTFIAIHGYEVCIKKDYNASSGYFQPLYHFNFISKSADNVIMPKFFRDHPSKFGNSMELRKTATNYAEIVVNPKYDVEWLSDYLGEIASAGFLVNYNHPQWSLQTMEDYIGLKNLHSIEVINGSCAKINDNTSIHYAQMLRAGMRVCPTGGDDTHSVREIGKAWTMIKAEELSYEALIKAYEQGDCYASEGPEILSFVLENGKIKVKTSPAAMVVLFGEGRYARGIESDTEDFCEAEFEYLPQKLGAYFRIEVRDRFGYKAFSNAYYTADIDSKLNNL